MIYKITFSCEEEVGFRRVFEMDSDATFLDLHKAILESVNYPDNQMTSFFLCNENWEKGQEVTLVEMGANFEYDNMVMEETRLSDLLEEQGQRLIYIFDPMFERYFFGSLKDIEQATESNESQGTGGTTTTTETGGGAVDIDMSKVYKKDGNWHVPVFAKSEYTSATQLSFTLEYDPAKAEFTGIEGLEEGTYTVEETTKGKVQLTVKDFAAVKALKAGDKYFEFVLKALDDSAKAQDLGLKLSDSYVYTVTTGDAMTFIIIGGALALAAAATVVVIRRKKEEFKLWEDRVQTHIERRKWEEELARRKEELRLLKERENMLKEARKKLIESALNNEEIVAEREAKRKEREEKLKAEREAIKKLAEEQAELEGKKPRTKRESVAARKDAIERVRQEKLAKKQAKKEREAKKEAKLKEIAKAKKAAKKEKVLAKEAEARLLAKQKKKEKRIKQQEKEKALLKEKKAQQRAKVRAKKAKAKKKLKSPHQNLKLRQQ